MRDIKYKVFFLSLGAAFSARLMISCFLRAVSFKKQIFDMPVKELVFTSLIILSFIIYGFILSVIFLKYCAKKQKREKIYDLSRCGELLDRIETVSKVGGWEIDLEKGGRGKWSRGLYDILEIELADPVPSYKEHINQYFPEYREIVKEKFDSLLKTGQSMEFEALIKTGKGNIKWCRATGEAVKKNNKIVKLRGIYQDLSRQKQDEDAIKKAQKRYYSILEIITSVVWISDPRGCFSEKQGQWERFTGQTWEVYKGRSWLEIIHPDDRTRVREVWDKALKRKEVFHVEVRIRKADGRYSEFEVMAKPSLDSEGVVKEWVGIFTDITKRKKQQNDLKQQKELFSSFFNKNNIGAVISSPEKRFIKVNPKFCDMVGYNEEELNNIKWQELVHPEDIEKNLALFEEIIRKKRDTYQLERRFIKKNGEIIYTDSNISCVRENDGTVKYFLVTIHDITKSKKAEEKIRYLARLPEENPDPVLRLTKGGSIDYVNPAARELMKIWEFEENGKVTRKWQRIINSVLRHGLTWFQEEKIGSRLFSIAVFPVVEEGYVNLYGRDITERRRAEKDLTASERRYKILYDTSLEAIIMLIPGKGFIGGNKASIELFGLENEEELLQKDMLGLSPEYQPDGGLSSVKIREINRIVMKKGAHFFEWVYKKKNGEEFFARVVLTKVEQEENVFFHATIRDVTEAKKLQEKLIKNEKLASLGKLVSDMAHEVNNPLMIVSGRAQISLMPETSAEEIQENLNVIIDQCMRAKEIIQRLLAFSRPSKGVISEIDLNKAVDCIVKLMEHQYALINIKMITCYEKDLPRILGDDKQLHEVFMNLIKNASEAMPEGGTITVVTRKENNEAVVEIKDTGEGISEKNIQKIFDPFFTTKINGTGLGLSVCYGLIKDHDGQMLVNSKQAEGTVVTIRFPGLKKGDKNRDYPVKK